MSNREKSDVPELSVIIPAGNAEPGLLRRAVESVLAQTMDAWQLIVVADSIVAELVDWFSDLQLEDSRLELVRDSNITGYAEAVNVALTKVSGQWAIVLRPEDVLRFDAVEKLALFVADRADASVIYSDEFLMQSEVGHEEILRKPDFSPERLRNQMYAGRFCAYRADVITKLRLRPGFDGAEDHDLLLRATEHGAGVGHIREALYGRGHSGPLDTPLLVHSRAEADATIRAIEEHLSRVGIEGKVLWREDEGVFRVIRQIVGSPLVSIVIPTRGSSAQIRGRNSCLVVDAIQGILEKSTYTNLEFVVVADEATPSEVIDRLREVAGDRLTLVPWDRDFNFSGKINKGVLHSRGDYVMPLNDDVEVITSDWVEAMLGLAMTSGVGLVGALLYFEDGTIQHGGHLYSGGGAGHIGFGWAGEFGGLPGSMVVDREVSGNTAACILLPRAVFLEVGGFTPLLPSNFNDVDFCMKVTGAGYSAVWTPHAQLFHFESKTRVSTVAAYEVETLYSRWQRRMAIDPYWPA